MGNERIPFAATLETYIGAIKDMHCGFATKIKSKVGFPFSDAAHILNVQTEEVIERANRV